MRWLLIGTMVALMVVLAVGHAVATDDSKVKNGTGHVETGVQKIGDGKIGEGGGEAAKATGKTVIGRAKFAVILLLLEVARARDGRTR
jgi:hypothetical protein